MRKIRRTHSDNSPPVYRQQRGTQTTDCVPLALPHDLILYVGLLYPIAVAVMTFIVGSFFIPETYKTRIWDEVGGQHAYLAAGGGGGTE